MKEIIFSLTPAMSAEVARIMATTNLRDEGELFQRAFTLLRIHVEAAMNGHTIELVTSRDRSAIVLPFTCQLGDRH